MKIYRIENIKHDKCYILATSKEKALISAKKIFESNNFSCEKIQITKWGNFQYGDPILLLSGAFKIPYFTEYFNFSVGKTR